MPARTYMRMQHIRVDANVQPGENKLRDLCTPVLHIHTYTRYKCGQRDIQEYAHICVCIYVYAHPSRPYLNACKRWAKDVDKEVDALVVTTISPALYIQW